MRLAGGIRMTGDPFSCLRSGNHAPSGTGNANLFYSLPGAPRLILVQERVKTATSGVEPRIDAFLEAFPVRTVPVQFPALVAPEKRVAGPVTRRVSGRRYLFFGCKPEYGVAERAPAHGEAPVDKAEIGKLLHLREHVACRDKHRLAAAPTGKLVVPGQEDPVFALCKRKEPGVLVGIPGPEPVCADRVVTHEPEVPGEGAQHPVCEKPGLLGSDVIRHGARSRSSRRSWCTAGRQGP